MTVEWDDWSRAITHSIKGVPDSVLARAAKRLRSASLVITAGNGGSAALASHAAQALLKPSYKAGGGVAAHCVSDNVETLSAHANDGGWVTALEEAARPFFLIGNVVLLLFSSSGKSENIVRLAKHGQDRDCSIIAFTGFAGEPLRSLATISIHVDSDDYEVVEPVHDALLHRVQYHLRNTG